MGDADVAVFAQKLADENDAAIVGGPELMPIIMPALARKSMREPGAVLVYRYGVAVTRQLIFCMMMS